MYLKIPDRSIRSSYLPHFEDHLLCLSFNNLSYLPAELMEELVFFSCKQKHESLLILGLIRKFQIVITLRACRSQSRITDCRAAASVDALPSDILFFRNFPPLRMLPSALLRNIFAASLTRRMVSAFRSRPGWQLLFRLLRAGSCQFVLFSC